MVASRVANLLIRVITINYCIFIHLPQFYLCKMRFFFNIFIVFLTLSHSHSSHIIKSKYSKDIKHAGEFSLKK
jgi:uncharacterized membrane protein YphA (DoxX/SURF4 family)